jgi:hypothetical protein
MRAQHSVVVAGAFAIALMASGCDMDTSLQGKVEAQGAKGFVKVSHHFSHGSQQGQFNFDGQTVSLKCQLTVVGTLNGQPSTLTGSTTVTMVGAAGAHYKMTCDDPLLMQFPLDAFGFVGLWTSPTGSGSFDVVGGLTQVLTGPTTSLFAESGQQLVMASLPADFPEDNYDMEIRFTLGSSRAINVKSAILAKVECNGSVFTPRFFRGIWRAWRTWTQCPFLCLRSTSPSTQRSTTCNW